MPKFSLVQQFIMNLDKDVEGIHTIFSDDMKFGGLGHMLAEKRKKEK